jgi:hypothetical protein
VRAADLAPIERGAPAVLVNRDREVSNVVNKEYAYYCGGRGVVVSQDARIMGSAWQMGLI